MEIITYLHLFHILFVGSLFLYVGIMKIKNHLFIYPVLLGLGTFLILFHGFKAYNKMKQGKEYIINLFHIFIVSPILIYIGYNKQTTSDLYFNILIGLGILAIIDHGYKLFINK